MRAALIIYDKIVIVAQMGYNCTYKNMNTKTATVRARVTPELKKTTEKVLATLGLSTSDAISLYFKQITLTKGLPFPVKTPNAETLAAISEAEKNKDNEAYWTKHESVDDLMADLTK
jgi:addiction module RelB/DinJ family antitoxin